MPAANSYFIVYISVQKSGCIVELNEETCGNANDKGGTYAEISCITGNIKGEVNRNSI